MKNITDVIIELLKGNPKPTTIPRPIPITIVINESGEIYEK